MNHQLISQGGTGPVSFALWCLRTHALSFQTGGTPFSFPARWVTLCLKNCMNRCKFLLLWMGQRGCISNFSSYWVCFVDSLNKTMSLTWENTAGLFPAPFSLCGRPIRSLMRHGRHLLCCKTSHTGTLFPSATCGCIWASSGNNCVVVSLWWFITHTSAHNPCCCLLHPWGDTGNSHVPACYIYFNCVLSYESCTTVVEKEGLAWTGRPGFLLFHCSSLWIKVLKCDSYYCLFWLH